MEEITSGPLKVVLLSTPAMAGKKESVCMDMVPFKREDLVDTRLKEVSFISKERNDEAGWTPARFWKKGFFFV